MTMALTAREFMDRMSPEYLAGFFDGEGYVGVKVNRHYSNQPYLRASVTQKKPEIIAALIAKFPSATLATNLNILKGRKGVTTCYVVTWYGINAKSFLEYIAPHVILKREQVLLALEFLEPSGKKFAIADRIRSINQESKSFDPIPDELKEKLQ